MSIDELNELEKKYKDAIFNEIRKSILKNSAAISKIKSDSEWLGQSRVGKIYNSSTTLNNKLVELTHVFEKTGISMFITKLEKYNLYQRSFLGDAIIDDLLNKYNTSIDKLTEYSKTMEEVSKQINERLLAPQNVSPIRKIFLQIRAFLVPVQPIDLSLTEEQQRLLDCSLQAYKDADSEIYNYNLEDNLVKALVNKINDSQINNVPGFLEESVIPDLKKLGLEHLIPQLQGTFAEEYKKNSPDSTTNIKDDITNQGKEYIKAVASTVPDSNNNAYSKKDEPIEEERIQNR